MYGTADTLTAGTCGCHNTIHNADHTKAKTFSQSPSCRSSKSGTPALAA
jgi:hypothetical protein